MKQTSNFWRKLLSLSTGLALVFQTIFPLLGGYQYLVRAEDKNGPEVSGTVVETIETKTPEPATPDESLKLAQPEPTQPEQASGVEAAKVSLPETATQKAVLADQSAQPSSPAGELLVAEPARPESTIPAQLVESVASVSAAPILVSDWQRLDEQTEQTVADVVTAREYRFQSTPVSVVFTKLPSPSGKLTIKKIILTEEQQETLGAFSNIAYDITSSMPNGSFQYDLTLPVPENAKGKEIKVKSSENVEDLTQTQDVNQEKIVQQETLTIKGLNHFTVFVLVNDLDNGGTASTTDDIANGSLTTIKDTYIDESSSTTNYGDSTTIKVSSQNSNRNERVLVKFDLTPLNSTDTVDKATLRLYMTSAPSNSRTYQVFRITSGDWVEGDGGTNNNPAGEVRWDNQPTSSVGGTSTASTGTTNNVWVEWDVTSDVQNFVNGTNSNYGWLIKDASESESSTARTATFRSRESGTQNERPQLVVDFATSASQPTQYNSPTATVATTGGDGDGFETGATNAFADGGGAASNINGAGDRHLYYNYGFSIPTGATINGVETRADWYLESTSGANSLSVELSWDTGATWTSAKTDSTETTEEHVVSFGGASDSWGRTWNASDFSNSNFRVRVTSNSDSSSRDFYLDWIPVRVYYTADTTPPSISFTDDVAVGPVLSDTISLSVTDANPDTASYAYGFSSDAACNALDTYGSPFTSGSPFTLNTEANNGKYLCAKAADLAGNIGYQRSANVLNIDRTAPTPTITSGPSGTVNSTSATFNFTADELVNFGCRINLEAFEICVFGSSAGSKTYTGLIDGAYTFTLQATDTVGNIDYFKNASQSWTVDATKPTTSDSGIDSNWHNTDVTVTLTCLDTGGAGCAATYYTTDGSTPTTGSSSGSSFTLSSNGTYTIKYFSTDLAGNSEAVKQAANQVKIDKTNPVDPSVSSTSHAISTPSNDTTIDISWSGATDGLSGVAGYSYLFDTSATTLPDTTSEGSGTSTTSLSLPNGSNYYFHLRTLDNAGNWTSTVHLGPFIIDTTAPSAPGTPSTTSPTNNNKPGWTWTAATDSVGIDHYVFYWGTTAGSESNNSGNLSAATLSFTHSVALTDGTWYGKVKAFDAANNSTVSRNGNVVVDVTAPATPSATPGAGDYFSDQSVVLASSDSGTGLASIYYTLDGSIPSSTSGTLYASAISIGTDKTLKAIAYDNVGNSSSVLTAQYNIAPVISAETASSVGSSTVTITWTTDDLSTSRVVYDTISHPELGESPNYGYANSTVEADTSPKVASHSVTLASLASATTYYYRAISHGSPEAVSSEKSFTTSSVTSSSDNSSSGGGIDNHPPAPTCGDSKPGSAPILTSAVAGTNSVTLFWTSAFDPVTYYLVTYGAGSGLQTYGNPNVGGSGATSYTVSGLSGGATYYFRVRAGNGCKPGDYSNELAATPFGGFISSSAAGFTPGVLGTTENLSTGEATESGAALGTQSGEVKDIANPSVKEPFPWWWIALVLALGAGGYLFWRRYH